MVGGFCNICNWSDPSLLKSFWDVDPQIFLDARRGRDMSPRVEKLYPQQPLGWRGLSSPGYLSWAYVAGVTHFLWPLVSYPEPEKGTKLLCLLAIMGFMVAADLVCLNLSSSLLALQGEGKYYRDIHEYSYLFHFPISIQNHFQNICPSTHPVLSSWQTSTPWLFFQLEMSENKA